MELVTAVQRCRAVLESLDSIGELYTDQETIASVIRNLPIDSPYQWGLRLVDWLESERKAAISIHLDDLASKMQNPSTTYTKPNPPKETTTDVGLLLNTNLM